MTGGQEAPVLVTGGGGFLGSAIVRMLRAGGQAVRSLTRHRYPELDALGVAQFLGDVADPEIVSRAVAGCLTVFHVAAKAGLWGPYPQYHHSNVVGTQNVIAACREHGVRRLIYTSSPSVVFTGHDLEGVDESVPYAKHYDAAYPATKAIAEKLVLANNDSTSCHRLAAPAPDLGAGRQQHPAADLCPGAGSSTLPDRPAQPAHRPDVHRQRRPGPSAGRRTPRAGLADHRPGLFHRPGPARSTLGHGQSVSRGGSSSPREAEHPPAPRGHARRIPRDPLHPVPASRRAANDAVPGP